jgi:hypothetical protein
VHRVPDPDTELHAMPPEAFADHVHSFEFWFGAVQGYLEGRPYGHASTATEPERTEAEREGLITVLC